MPSFQPTKRLRDGSFDDRGTHHGDRQTSAVFGNQRLRQALGQRVCIGPAQFCAPVSCQHSVRYSRSQRKRFLRIWFSSAAPCRSLAACSLLKACWRSSSVTSGLSADCFSLLHDGVQRTPFLFRIEIGNSGRSVIRAHGFAHTSVPRSRHIAGGKMQAARHGPTGAQIP